MCNQEARPQEIRCDVAGQLCNLSPLPTGRCADNGIGYCPPRQLDHFRLLLLWRSTSGGSSKQRVGGSESSNAKVNLHSAAEEKSV